MTDPNAEAIPALGRGLMVVMRWMTFSFSFAYQRTLRPEVDGYLGV